MTLTPAEAAALYRSGMSACQIAHAHGITRQGAEARIRAGGLGGVQWCPIHRVHEELHMANAEAVSLPHARWSPPRWVQPELEELLDRGPAADAETLRHRVSTF